MDPPIRASENPHGLVCVPCYENGMESTDANSSADALFPTLIADPEPATLGEPLIQLTRVLLKKVNDLPDNEDLSEAKDATLAEVRQMIKNLYLRFAAPADKAIYERLRQARKSIGMTTIELAKRSGVSTRQINRVESDNDKVSQRTLMALCTVPALGLVPKELLEVPTIDEIEQDRSSFVVASGFDSLYMHKEMKRLLNSKGGALEQTHVYLDHDSSSDWIDLCNSPDYVAKFRLAFPHREAAQCVVRYVGKAGLDLVMLGPGDGQTEVLFTQHVLAETTGSFVCMHLLDASQPLLNKAYGHAIEKLGQEPRVFVSAIQGSFFQLSRYRVLNASQFQPHRRRVYTIFGNTIANLDNEASFFQKSFSGAMKGDLLLMDADQAFTAEAHDPTKISEADPALKAPVPDAHCAWLTGPIRRYCRNVEKINLSYRVDSSRPIPGSYGLQFVANVTLDNGQPREFVVWQVRRYDHDKLSTVVQKLGWAEVGRFLFSSMVRPRSLLVFQKQ